LFLEISRDADILMQDTKSWNSDTVTELFEQEVTDKILHTTLNPLVTEDVFGSI